jgi:hypothetical protein
MSIQAADLRKLVKIVRQYEVIYGGGISSGDAAVREECESLVGLLEVELGGTRAQGGRGSRAAESLPSLVDAKRKIRGEGFPKPSTARSSEMAKLGSPGPRPGSSVKEKTRPAEPLKASAPRKNSVSNAPVRPAAPATKASAPKGPVAKASAPSAATTAGKKAAAKSGRPDDVDDDVRSRHVPAARAAIERSDRIAGAADASSDAETKHRFAALHLFDAFQQNRLPKYGGFIVSIRFANDTGYSVIEIIGYENLQDIYPEGDSLVFKSVGCKLFAIVEPSGYLMKSVEPVNRPSEQMVPYRFAELLALTTKRFQKILVGRKPVFMPTSFSVIKPAGENLAVLFYDIADVYANIQDFLIMIFRDRLGVPIPDSRKAAEIIARGIHEFRLWLDEA